MIDLITGFLGDKVKMVVFGAIALAIFLLGFIIGAWMGGTTVYIYTEDGQKKEVKFENGPQDLPQIIRESYPEGANSEVSGSGSPSNP